MERIHTKDDLLLILSYMRASDRFDFSGQDYRSLRNTHIVNLARFMWKNGIIKNIIK